MSIIIYACLCLVFVILISIFESEYTYVGSVGGRFVGLMILIGLIFCYYNACLTTITHGIKYDDVVHMIDSCESHLERTQTCTIIAVKSNSND